MSDTNPPRYRLLWIVVIALLIALGLIFALQQSEEAPEAAPAPEPVPTATAPSDEYTTAPEEPGVAVDLPDTTPNVRQVNPGAAEGEAGE